MRNRSKISSISLLAIIRDYWRLIAVHSTRMGYKKYFPHSSFTICSNFPHSSLPSSNLNFPRSSSPSNINFPRSSFQSSIFIWNEERGKLRFLLSNEERRKLKLKNLSRNPIFLYPSFQAFLKNSPKIYLKKANFLHQSHYGNSRQPMSKMDVKIAVFSSKIKSFLATNLKLPRFRANFEAF